MLDQWLRDALEKSGISQAALSRALSEKLKRSIDRAAVNKMTKGRDAGGRAIAADELLAIAEITGVAPPENDRLPSTIPVVGLVGAGGLIDTEWENQAEPLFEIEIPFPLSDDAIGLQISGDSMWPKYDDGDVIVVSKRGEEISELKHQEAAVRVSDGGRYFKRIVPSGTPSLFDLESYNAPTMRAVQIDWASGLIARVPASRWRRLSGAAVKAAVKRARKAAK